MTSKSNSLWRKLFGSKRKGRFSRKDTGVDTRDKNGLTPLYRAVAHGQTETVKNLIEKGADVNLKDKNGWTPLHRAAQLGHRKVAEMLINAGAKINAKDLRGRRPLTVVRNREPGIVDLLRQHGAKE